MTQRTLDARGLYIVGSTRTLTDHKRREGFELWRNSQRDIDIVTFDELRVKVGLTMSLIESATAVDLSRGQAATS